MTLNEVMKETAEAIREKKGTSELIAPVDFAEEIKGISAGGGESGGELYMKYYDIDAMASSLGVEKQQLLNFISEQLYYIFMLVRLYNPDIEAGGVMPLYIQTAESFNITKGIGILYGYEISEAWAQFVITPEFVASKLRMSLDQFEITKEQFYTFE